MSLTSLKTQTGKPSLFSVVGNTDSEDTYLCYRKGGSPATEVQYLPSTDTDCTSESSQLVLKFTLDVFRFRTDCHIRQFMVM